MSSDLPKLSLIPPSEDKQHIASNSHSALDFHSTAIESRVELHSIKLHRSNVPKPMFVMIKPVQSFGDSGNVCPPTHRSTHDNSPVTLPPMPMHSYGLSPDSIPGLLHSPRKLGIGADQSHNLSNIVQENECSHWNSFAKDFPELN